MVWTFATCKKHISREMLFLAQNKMAKNGVLSSLSVFIHFENTWFYDTFIEGLPSCLKPGTFWCIFFKEFNEKWLY